MSAVAIARKQLKDRGGIVAYSMTPTQAEKDAKVRASIKERHPNAWSAAQLAQAAGFKIEIKVNEFDDGEIFSTWHVTAPEKLDRRLEALVWDYAGGEIEHTLTRSTSHPGWQLTHWMLDGSPYGHSDVFGNIADAFDTRATASGEPVTGLAQVVFRDGRVLVRSGFKKVEVNPRKGKAKFDEADLSHLLSPPGADPRIGLERGKAAKNGIALFINPWGSYRYVLYEDRCPIAAIQIVRHGDHGRHGIIAGVYTRPDRRAQGLATKLEARAKKDFDVISHSEHLTTAGAAFKRKLMGR